MMENLEAFQPQGQKLRRNGLEVKGPTLAPLSLTPSQSHPSLLDETEEWQNSQSIWDGRLIVK